MVVLDTQTVTNELLVQEKKIYQLWGFVSSSAVFYMDSLPQHECDPFLDHPLFPGLNSVRTKGRDKLYPQFLF